MTLGAADAASLIASVLLGAILVGCTGVEILEFFELMRLRARRKEDKAPASRSRPYVSFHVPICSEPPDVVVRTLQALSNIDYDSFEVVVVDNNTSDERLWRPVEAACRDLGPRFRFFHLPTWPGFKAGALNFALTQTAPQAMLIGVVDADYEASRHFLAETVGYFDDPSVVFVQTPQDYRDWSDTAFSRMCYWEYWQVFAVSMTLRNEHNAILMHGTMCLTRKEAISAKGGWAEWCLTEDSELGLRLLADGHRSVYVTKTHGRGLLPFTFRDYKQQRRRWVIGGAQQFKRHFATFLLEGGSNRMTLTQKLQFLRWWLFWFRDGMIVASVPLSMAAAVAILFGGINAICLLPLAIGLAGTAVQFVLRLIVVYRRYLGLTWREGVGAMIASCSLTWTVGLAWLVGLITRKQGFQRTPKKAHSDPLVGTSGYELLMGVTTLALGIAIWAHIGIDAWPAILALWIYTALFLPASWMAWTSARIRK